MSEREFRLGHGLMPERRKGREDVERFERAVMAEIDIFVNSNIELVKKNREAIINEVVRRARLLMRDDDGKLTQELCVIVSELLSNDLLPYPRALFVDNASLAEYIDEKLEPICRSIASKAERILGLNIDLPG